MSVGQSEATQEEPEPRMAGEQPGEANAPEATWPALGESVVPMLGPTRRELDRRREERVRTVVKKGHRPLPRPPARAALLGLGGLATVLLAVALASAAGGGNGNVSPQRTTKPRSALATNPPARLVAHAARPRHTRARALDRRRAAIRAHREAARRRARERRARKKAADRAKRHRQSAPTGEPAAGTDVSAEPAPPPSEAVSSTPPPPTSAAPTSSSPSQVQREFGFEH